LTEASCIIGGYWESGYWWGIVLGGGIGGLHEGPHGKDAPRQPIVPPRQPIMPKRTAYHASESKKTKE